MTAPDRIERNFKTWQAMEKEVCDVAQMARATTFILEIYMEQKSQVSKQSWCTGADLVAHLAEWSDSVNFMVGHLDEMAGALMRHYE